MVRALFRRAAGVESLREWTRHQLGRLSARLAGTEKAAAHMGKRVDSVAATIDEEHKRVSDVATRLKPLRDVPRQVTDAMTRLAAVEQAVQNADLVALRHRVHVLERVLRATAEMGPLFFAPPDAVRDRQALVAHLRAAVAGATLHTDPSPHIVIDEVLPREYYDYLLAMLPPAECFNVDNKYKQNFRPYGRAMVPAPSRVSWQSFERDLVAAELMPALLEKFAPAILPHYELLVGRELAPMATALPKEAAGRVLLRRPGYRQGPHLDPKSVLLTGLLYLARRGDAELYGTSMYRVDRPFVHPSKNTFYPESEGYACSLAKLIEFRANRLFVFLNSQAAHGAELPIDAPLHERYAYQFYVTPIGLEEIVNRLPDAERALWAGLPGVVSEVVSTM